VLVEDVVILDFETTGLNPDRGDRMTEVAALRVRGGRVVESFESLVNCGVQVPAYISKFTGITQSMVDTAPEPSVVIHQLLDFIGSNAVIAHNAGFDQCVLENECKHLGIVNPLPDFICSVLIARCMFPDMKSHALGCLASRLGIPFAPGAHRAAVDATVTASILLRACDLIRTRFAVPRVDASVLRRIACAVHMQDTPAASAAA